LTSDSCRRRRKARPAGLLLRSSSLVTTSSQGSLTNPDPRDDLSVNYPISKWIGPQVSLPQELLPRWLGRSSSLATCDLVISDCGTIRLLEIDPPSCTQHTPAHYRRLREKKHVTIPASRSQCGGSAAITDRTITPEPRAPTAWCWGLGPRTSSNLDHKNVPSLSIHRLGSRLENFPPRNPTGRAGVPPSSEMNRYQGPLKTDTVLAVPARHRASSTAYRAICAH